MPVIDYGFGRGDLQGTLHDLRRARESRFRFGKILQEIIRNRYSSTYGYSQSKWQSAVLRAKEEFDFAGKRITALERQLQELVAVGLKGAGEALAKSLEEPANLARSKL